MGAKYFLRMKKQEIGLKGRQTLLADESNPRSQRPQCDTQELCLTHCHERRRHRRQEIELEDNFENMGAQMVSGSREQDERRRRRRHHHRHVFWLRPSTAKASGAVAAGSIHGCQTRHRQGVEAVVKELGKMSKPTKIRKKSPRSAPFRQQR